MRLCLIRHGEAEISGDHVADHDRPLTRSGREQARALGEWLAERGEQPSLVQCSSAQRARETVDAILAALPQAAAPTVSRELYLASSRRLLELLRETPSSHGSLLLVGHNPGVAELAMRFAGRGEPHALRRLAGGFPPAACARIVFPRDVFPRREWRALEPGAGELDDYWTPARW